jgi:integrase
MASIQKYQTKEGKTRYRVMWRDGNKPKSKSFDKWTPANDFKISLEHTKREGSYVAPSKLTVREYLKDWLDTRKDGLSNSSAMGYAYNINHANEYIGDLALQGLNASDIEKMYKLLRKDKQLSGTYLLYIHRVLNIAFKDACKKKLINNNPCQYADAPKKNKFTASFVRPDDVSDYLALFADSWIYPAIAISLFCGLRRSEILALQWENIDFKNGKINVKHSVERIKGEFILKSPKSGKSRSVNMPVGIIDLLQSHKKKQKENRLLLGEKYNKSDFVITEDNGTRPDPKYVTRFVSRRLKASKLSYIRFHDLRHTAASLMILEGNDIKTVSDILGHASIAITADTYAHVIEESKKKAADSLNKYLQK